MPDPKPEADALLLRSIDDVLARVDDVADPEGRRALRERAATLRDTVLDWQALAPSAGEREDITEKVLKLHSKLSRLLRGELV
jgi:hypothetical protein